MNKFGGNWTENKIEILIEYAKAYLTIMKKYAEQYNWQLLYFDGFAGSGEIIGEDENSIVGAAKRILEIDQPRAFDLYYFVEKEKDFAESLKKTLHQTFSTKKNLIHVANNDCNEKIKSMSRFLSGNGKKYKSLAYIDPYGMQVNWESLQTLKEHSVDVWILVPTGIGLNRLLKNDGEISEAWMTKLEMFLGMTREEILPYFYQESTIYTLFGEVKQIKKENNAIEKAAKLYEERLNKLFKFVSKPYVLKNKNNSIMFHFFMASDTRVAVNIANSIIKKFNNGTI
ncbi:three-Cys-motif partner protein TcmP [Chryseobacterium nepalense]|uniref:Three-Cys-motif partner protein TcmP n=1 Tax=Chryseobacterium nepalense TaxID=1854498 RepID=A0ABY4K946_9FLAO|nr:three-Cys-motif partner protein TcmP [Chryseobacterium nepalense]UPQ76298.1 three-Cys-motif partner protein TcmP [Chryseobacterium nepalense]